MKHGLRVVLFVCIVLALLTSAAGCAAKPAAVNGKSAEGYNGAASSPMAPSQPNASKGSAGIATDSSVAMDPAAQAEAAVTDRKVILNSSLVLTVQETEKTVANIQGLVSGRKGYVAGSNVWRESNILHAQMTVHVPAEGVNEFIAEVKKLAVRVERENSSGQDVTAEYVDLQARLTNLEAAETELRQIMTEARQKTEKAEDVMAVYKQLTEVRGQIEQIKGRMQYIDRMTAMATVTLDLSERQAEPIGQPGWQPSQTLRRAFSALVQTGKFLVDALIWVGIYVLPMLIVPAIALWLLWRLTRRRRRQA